MQAKSGVPLTDRTLFICLSCQLRLAFFHPTIAPDVARTAASPIPESESPSLFLIGASVIETVTPCDVWPVGETERTARLNRPGSTFSTFTVVISAEIFGAVPGLSVVATLAEFKGADIFAGACIFPCRRYRVGSV